MPKYYHLQGKWNKSDYNFNAFLLGIIDYSKLIKLKYNIDDETFNRLQRLALSLAALETSFGDKRRMHNKVQEYDKYPIMGTLFGSFLTKLFFKKDASRGLSNIKYFEQNNGIERQKDGSESLTDKDVLSSLRILPEDLWDPQKAGVATIAVLASIYNRHRNEFDLYSYKESDTTRRRTPSGKVYWNKSTNNAVQYPNKYANLPLSMEDVLSAMWNGYINGKTKIAAPHGLEGSSYPYVNEQIRSQIFEVDPDTNERIYTLPELIISNKKGGIMKEKYNNGNINGNVVTIGNLKFNITSNSDVLKLLKYLNSIYHTKLDEDGLYGLKTINATHRALVSKKNDSINLFKNNYRKSNLKTSSGNPTYYDSKGYEFAFGIKDKSKRYYDNNGDRIFSASETNPSKNNTRYLGKTLIPELQKLSGSLISLLRKTYGLSASATIDNQLLNALTKDAYKKYSKFDLSNPKTQTDCTKYVLNQIYRKIDSNPDLGYRAGRLKSYKANIGGNAWDIGSNISKGGGTLLFDMYKGWTPLTKRNSVKTTKAMWQSGWRPDVSQLQVGDVVGLFYEPSPHHNEVATGTGVAQNYTGPDLNTHAGLVVGYDANGNPIVSHNVHGTVYNEPMIQGTIYGGKPNGWGNRPTGFIVSAYRPNYNKAK